MTTDRLSPTPNSQLLTPSGWYGPSEGLLASYPPREQWDDWVELDAKAWPKRVERHYMLVPTICFNCEAACGLLAYVDRETLAIKKFEGNPEHPASRGRNCAKGPATINQVNDPERILYPLKRVGPRGSGQWERVSWDAVLDDIGGRIRQAFLDGRRGEVMYHVGRPGHDGYMDRVLQSWGVDGHNSHTNVCSAAARLGYDIWQGADRPSPDHANARFILLLSSHLETGHYFNPHAQRIIEGKKNGAKLAVFDPRLSNTASIADYWLATWPGSEAAVLLAIARILLKEGMIDREFVRRWTNWRQFMQAERPQLTPSFENFLVELERLYDDFTPEYAAREARVRPEPIVQIARDVGRAGSALSTHVWRGAASGNQGGWQVARCLELLNVLTGSIGTPGGTSPNSWDKFVPAPFVKPPPQTLWNELLWPKEYPLSHHEMSFLLPHFLKEGRGKLAVYFTRVYNPVWTNPDGAAWIEALSSESTIGLHAALTPTWSETAHFADYVLPMGVGAERHDIQSQETHASQWIAFRQPVRRVAMERLGKKVTYTYEANPGEVWEEDEFWTELSWRIDPDGSLGIRKYFESPYRPGEKLTEEDYYRWIFENSVPGLPEAAAKESLTPLEYMRRYGAFEVRKSVYGMHETALTEAQLSSATVDADSGLVRAPDGTAIGVEIDGVARAGFPTPSRRLEFYSPTLAAWRWPEHSVPGYIKSHVHWEQLDPARNEFVLVPTFRLPTLIHTRGGNAKWLYEISHTNPLWIHPDDAARLGVGIGDLVRVSTEIGYFVVNVWVTDAMRPGVVACSHHLGRWRLTETTGERWSTVLSELTQPGAGRWMLRQKESIKPFDSDDPDSRRVFWRQGGVHQNLTFPVHPDPVSGMHCWHQKVRLERARPEDRYGDAVADTAASMRVYREWLALTRPAPGPDGTRRPLWLLRAVKPAAGAYQMG
jgi:anaerobic selenocysteine-containing dehydrogenase